MPCTCNSICDHDCASNQLCTGHVPACSNTYTFTSITVGRVIYAADLTQLHLAIDGERTDSGRRFNASEPDYCYTHTPGNVACSNNDFSAYSWTSGVGAGGKIYAQHMQDIKDANNEVFTNSGGYGGLVSYTFAAYGIIYASQMQHLQTKINESRNVCICDSHCNCDPSDCGCNGECPSDDYYTYYYP